MAAADARGGAASAGSGGVRVEARGLSRSFGSHPALADVSLRIERGETFGLLGANGAGKTTFIRLVTGYLLPSSGSVLVDGLSPRDNPRAVHQRIGFAAERPKLYPDLRVGQFLRFAGGLRGLSGAALAEAVSRGLARFAIADHEDRLIGNLSKGYQQRVSLAQAFLDEPPLLIVDEPTSGLDPLQRADVRNVIAGLAGQHTVLLCTHDLAEARQLCSRVAVLHLGHLVALGPSEAVLGDAADVERALALFRGEQAAPEEPAESASAAGATP
jgi:ABC-2 type transport system ATP-binding protein